MLKRKASEPRYPVHRLNGHCLCGAVQIGALVTKTFGACHCRMCRQWSGGLWMGVKTVGKPDITGPVSVHKSSIYADRGFCSKCGSAIWHRERVSGKKAITLALGLFEDQDGWTMTREIYADARPDHYALASEPAPDARAYTGWGTMWAFFLGFFNDAKKRRILQSAASKSRAGQVVEIVEIREGADNDKI